MFDTLQITYEAQHNEPIHPDPLVAQRFIEVALSDCDKGCKLYADPMSNVVVLGHSRTYGCRK